jgi:hypothetical protein
MFKKSKLYINDDLYNFIQNKIDGSAAGVCQSVLSPAPNPIGRLASAFGPKYLNELCDVLKGYSGEKDESFYKLHALILNAMCELYDKQGKERPVNTPVSPQELLDIPMNPEVKDIKSSLSYRDRSHSMKDIKSLKQFAAGLRRLADEGDWLVGDEADAAEPAELLPDKYSPILVSIYMIRDVNGQARHELVKSFPAKDLEDAKNIKMSLTYELENQEESTDNSNFVIEIDENPDLDHRAQM